MKVFIYWLGRLHSQPEQFLFGPEQFFTLFRHFSVILAILSVALPSFRCFGYSFRHPAFFPSL
ncbi:hypothetical protein [Lysinibacillus sp. CTST325]